MIRIGNVFEIPLSDNRRAYGQYVVRSERGPLIRVFNLITQNVLDDVELLKDIDLLFPPIITGVFAATRVGMWKVIGKFKVSNFIFPSFISTFYNDETGEARIWYLWDGNTELTLGHILPDRYKHLEYLMVWDPKSVVKRIETGEYPFPYQDLIKFNRFTPVHATKIK